MDHIDRAYYDDLACVSITAPRAHACADARTARRTHASTKAAIDLSGCVLIPPCRAPVIQAPIFAAAEHGGW
jgi:hypothetical protein